MWEILQLIVAVISQTIQSTTISFPTHLMWLFYLQAKLRLEQEQKEQELLKEKQELLKKKREEKRIEKEVRSQGMLCMLCISEKQAQHA